MGERPPRDVHVGPTAGGGVTAMSGRTPLEAREYREGQMLGRQLNRWRKRPALGHVPTKPADAAFAAGRALGARLNALRGRK